MFSTSRLARSPMAWTHNCMLWSMAICAVSGNVATAAGARPVLSGLSAYGSSSQAPLVPSAPSAVTLMARTVRWPLP